MDILKELGQNVLFFEVNDDGIKIKNMMNYDTQKIVKYDEDGSLEVRICGQNCSDVDEEDIYLDIDRAMASLKECVYGTGYQGKMI